MPIHIPPGWRLPEHTVTPEALYLSRRRFLAGVGLGSLAAVGAAWGWQALHRAAPLPLAAPLGGRPDPRFADAGRALTREDEVLSYNNYYEFSTDKRAVAQLARGFKLEPYTLTVDGLVDRPRTFDLAQIEALGVEERVYRHRCVEAWAMAVPWLGVPLSSLLRLVEPQAAARHVAITCFHDPAQAPGQRNDYFAWPYYESLRLDEAMNELSLLVSGIYGKRLAPQNGHPLRLVLPWKYGFKGPKALVRMTLTAAPPPTFWNDLAPDEYSLLGNVDPHTPHPRWSQANERLIDTGERVPTEIYNGYGAWVAGLYPQGPT